MDNKDENLLFKDAEILDEVIDEHGKKHIITITMISQNDLLKILSDAYGVEA